MSEPENFLERWSRRKREAADEPNTSQPPETETEEKPKPASLAPGDSIKAEKPFDVSSLPSIDSIVGDTDIRGFLQAGVPEELRHAALRRAWTTDPQIRDFVGLVENGWDFNDPNAMHGFGPIEPSEVARLMGNFAMTPPPPEPSEIADKDQRGPPNTSAAPIAEGNESPPVDQDAPVPPTTVAGAPVGDAASQKESDAACSDAPPDHQMS